MECNQIPNGLMDTRQSVPGQGMFGGHRASGSAGPPPPAVCCSDIQASVRSCPGSCSGLQSQSGRSEPRCCYEERAIYFRAARL